MRIALASDHAGFSLKKEIEAVLQGQGLETRDFGTHDEEACDLSDFVYPAALAVGRGEVDRGIFVDGVGYGSALIANARVEHEFPDVDRYRRRVDKVREISERHLRPLPPA